MTDSDKIAIAGLIITAMLGMLNTLVALFINKRTIQAALELAQPPAKLRARTRKRKKRHPIRLLVKVQRVEQFLGVLIGLPVLIEGYRIFQTPNQTTAIRWSAITLQLVFGFAFIYSAVMAQKIINTIRKNIRVAARKLKQEGKLFLNPPSKADSQPTPDT